MGTDEHRLRHIGADGGGSQRWRSAALHGVVEQ